jgi:catechol 2,3-dioxygenase-like lactoylglutathione lyase family enzyme
VAAAARFGFLVREVCVPDNVRARQRQAVLDHVAVGARALTDGWDLFGGLLGGAWAYGGHSRGFWWGQLRYSLGPKVELLTPTGGADSAFLERFLAGRGPGIHHLNFIVPAIDVTLARIAALGIEPVGVRLENPQWKEAFLRPGDAYGTVIQVAEQAGPSPSSPPPAGLVEPGPSCSLSLIEQHVPDIDGAIRLFQEALDGEVVSRRDTSEGPAAELSWHNGARLRLVQHAADGHCSTPLGAGGIAYLDFRRDEGTFGSADLDKVAALSRRLGVSLRLDA